MALVGAMALMSEETMANPLRGASVPRRSNSGSGADCVKRSQLLSRRGGCGGAFSELRMLVLGGLARLLTPFGRHAQVDGGGW